MSVVLLGVRGALHIDEAANDPGTAWTLGGCEEVPSHVSKSKAVPPASYRSHDSALDLGLAEDSER
jgi:hypothetical protein